MKSDGIYYYCNIASPFIIEEGTIKYIDYDLDLRIFNGGEYKVLDKSEYKYHKKLMNYSDDLDLIINSALDELINLYLNNAIMFNKNMNYKYLDEYNKIKSEQI